MMHKHSLKEIQNYNNNTNNSINNNDDDLMADAIHLIYNLEEDE
jgi:hypothetical protein